jgi:hypothetical protein
MRDSVEGAPAISDAEFQALKVEWRSSVLASWLVRHALCVTERDSGVVVAWLEADALRCWCRCHDEAVEVPAGALPVIMSENFLTVLCAGAATSHPFLFAEDRTGEMLARCVNRLAVVLRRAALLAVAGEDGAVH